MTKALPRKYPVCHGVICGPFHALCYRSTRSHRYDLCKRHIIPSIRPGRRFIISRTAYEKWEASIGTDKPFDVHDNMMPGCRERIRRSWDLREQALFAREELLASLKSAKKLESN